MDVYSGKRAVGGITAPRKVSSSGHALRDTGGSSNGPVQICSRLGCSGRLNHSKGSQNNCLQKPKPLRPSFRSPYGKEVMGSSSKNSSGTNSSNSLHESHKKLSLKIGSSSTNSSRNTTEFKSKSESKKAVLMPVGKTIETASSNTNIRNGYRQKSGVSIQDAQTGSSDNVRRNNIVNKRFADGERCPSARGKKISDPSSHVNGVSSVRTRRSVNVDTAQHGNSSSSLVRSTNGTPHVPQTETHWFSAETSSSGSIAGFTDCNGSRLYSIDGIADVLLALERIEQDEELTYEELLSLEANPFLDALNFYDQHRDMRLDIDNMSYEELLALEEKMGTVSTALSEEKLSKCLRVGVYEPLHPKQRQRAKCSLSSDDTKCSICQEELVAGDEVGSLGCTHGYHAPCINHWLRLKNWCPICKASVESSVS